MTGASNRKHRRAHIEWPTLGLAVVIYGSSLVVTWWHDQLPVWVLLLIGGWLIAWHGSFQHETIHGHPTGIRSIDALIGSVPLSLWLPYAVYRRSHLAHHAAETVTDPFEDPESRYLANGAGPRAQLLALSERLQSSLAGRLVLGPPLTIARFLAGEVGRGLQDPATVLRDWIPHLAGVVLVLAWLDMCGFGVAQYLLLFVYPGTALSLLRSFAEHRAHAQP